MKKLIFFLILSAVLVIPGYKVYRHYYPEQNNPKPVGVEADSLNKWEWQDSHYFALMPTPGNNRQFRPIPLQEETEHGFLRIKPSTE